MKLPSLTLALLGLVLSCARADQTSLHVFQHENVLGSSLELKISATSDAAAEKAESAALAEIDRVAKIISTYDTDSEVSRWLRTEQQAVNVAPELLEVLALYDRWQGRSHGALSAGAAALSRLWNKAERERRLPAQDEIEAAVTIARAAHWKIDASAGTVTHLDQAPLSLDAAGKGYIVGRACTAALAVSGVRGAIVNIGGDLVVRGEISEQVDIVDPRDPAENAAPIARLTLQDRAVATSGNYRRGVDIAGRHFSHIIDPRSGKPADQVISATAVASDAADADALATIFSVLTPAESLQFAESLPGVECLLITRDGRNMASRGWSALESPRLLASAGDVPLGSTKSASDAPARPVDGTWDPAWELTVEFELARIQDQRARRPFVAVWVEDKDSFPVRTLALWFNGARWLPDLRSWYQGDQLRALAEGTNLVASLSSATRAPGKYTLKWDGRDNSGKPVKAGKYTVLIESAREHGTHQLMRQELDFSGVPQHVDLRGNAEIASASVDYHKKPVSE